ncbi:MAG: methionine--tRNA ligase subunit beta, partial [Bacteroidales bacterium]|nr:methionine--tRNA ligase subunit beta [Bacteroidales bacterium]
AIEDLNDYDKSVLEEISQVQMKVGVSLNNFRFREALNEMMNLARLGNKYLTDSEPWKVIKTDEARVRTVLNISLQICANLSIVSRPFLPFTADKLAAMLNIDKLVWLNAGRTDLLPDDHQLDKPAFLFEKIEDQQIEAQVQKLLDTKKANQQAEAKAAPAKETIQFDDFAKIDLRVGTILEAEKVPKTKKLLKLLIDTGIDKRTVVSGIAEDYKPEEIVGKKVTILVNLAPRKLKGIESNGMILMAENHEGKLSFITPSEDFEAGSEIR